MMCACRSRLTMSTIEASVVDLPEPVGPVTTTNPRGYRARSATARQPSSSMRVISYGIRRKAAPIESRW